MSNIIVIWQYKINPDKKQEFEKLYGKDGAWIKLFRKFPDYITTDLIKAVNYETVYLTLDRWRSKESYKKFKEDAKEEFSKIDEMGKELTLEEKYIGEYLLK